MTRTSQNRQGVLQDLSGEAALYRLSELATEFGAENIASTARNVAERVSEGRFYVACVGQFKRGKSTLLNALIGHPVLPTAVVPVTAVPTIIRHGERLAARVRFQSEAWTNIPINAVEEYVSEGKNPENAKGVAGVEIFVPSPLLETGMCLVDTPGLGSVFVENTAATHAFIPHIDAAIVVIGADPPLSGDELQLVETVSQEVHDLLFVLNKADRANAAERSAALDFARRVLETRLKRTLPAILEVSALDRLEQSGPERDWGQLIHVLEDLVLHSGRLLVRKATDRGNRRAANQLLAVIKEERDALKRPLEESERRIARLRKTLGESEAAIRDLRVLLSAEQQRLSGVFVERRNAFLKQAQVNAYTGLTGGLSSLARSHNGPAYRRNMNHLAQEIARAQLTPWLEGEAEFAERQFRKIAERFVELANEFLHRLGETDVPGLEELPEDLGSDQGLSVRSQFHFHVIERVAAPASPLLFISDLLLGGIGLLGGIVRDAHEFLDQLLEVNSSRVQSDVDERVQESRRRLEAEIKRFLREASAIADRALARARAAQAGGTPAIEAALARLHALEREVVDLSRPVATA
ncbi:MAG TPA: dynamin family protein [Candidatus Acidoferrales bacterium]|nr:dynamin family protein [Candidatus Acidoferrales bacterium]